MTSSAISSSSQTPVAAINFVTPSFSVQMFSAKQLADQHKFALENNISSVDTKLCEDKIRLKYKIIKRLFIQKIDYSSDFNSQSLSNQNSTQNTTTNNIAAAGTSMQFKMFNPNNASHEYNLTDECSDVNTIAMFPIPNNTKINVANYRKIRNWNKQQNYNILNQTDQFFTNRCVIYSNDQGNVLTLKERLNQFFPNQTDGCAQGCTFLDIVDNYIQCQCKTQGSLASNILIAPLKEDIFPINYDIILCFNVIYNSSVYKFL